MSSQVNTYVLYGVVLKYDDVQKDHAEDEDAYERFEPYTDNAFEAEANPKDDITVLYDGMNGEYVAIGHVIEKSRNHQPFGKPIAMRGRKPSKNVRIRIANLAGVSTSDLGWHVISHHR